jgi:hypothetical protein
MSGRPISVQIRFIRFKDEVINLNHILHVKHEVDDAGVHFIRILLSNGESLNFFGEDAGQFWNFWKKSSANIENDKGNL